MMPVVKFTATGTTTWTVPDRVTRVSVLVVAGGGGGGVYRGAGGGGGGVLYDPAYAVMPGEIVTVTVGAGGVGGIGGTYISLEANGAKQGGDSRFGNLLAVGGGYGGIGYNTIGAGGDGGSGGGGGGESSAAAGGSGSPGQGCDGGAGFLVYDTVAQRAGGGGGGAGSAGTDAGAGIGGAGGAGMASSISGAATYYGGGGGGAPNTLGSVGAGGIGGGAAGAISTSKAPSGAANTGGGGGGNGGGANVAGDGGDGGSGTVIVFYDFPAPDAPTLGTRTYQSIQLILAEADGATSYKIYRDGAYVGTTAALQYVDTGLDPFTAYAYTVSAVIGGDETAHSAAVIATTRMLVAAVSEVTLSPNPAQINAAFVVVVTAVETEIVMYTTSKISGAATSGRRVSLATHKEEV